MAESPRLTTPALPTSTRVSPGSSLSETIQHTVVREDAENAHSKLSDQVHSGSPIVRILGGQCSVNGDALALSKDLTIDAQVALRTYMNLHENYVQAIMFGQYAQAHGIKDAMDKHFGNLKVMMDENKALQETILQMQQQAVDMQQQTLDRLACGTHTTAEGSKIPDAIHLAKHDGYDLEKPTEFFERYGDYVILMMRMFKIGFTAAGIIVPALSHCKVVEGLDTIQKALEISKSSVGELVGKTISFIEDNQNKAGSGIKPTQGCIDLDKQEILEGADLRELESYLRVQDKGRTLGNLYRTVTPDGYVKWVCIDHYRTNYREATMESLKTIVKTIGGSFHEGYGFVKCVLKSQFLAEQIYKAIIKAKGIKQMEVEFCWDATLDDLRTFKKAMGEAHVVHLSINGRSLKRSTLDSILKRRYQPIVELMSNGRIQSLYLTNFVDFYSRLGDIPFAQVHHLRVLSIDSLLRLDDLTVATAFTRILEVCPFLVDLRLYCDNLETCVQFLKDNSALCQNLKTVLLETPDTLETHGTTGAVITVGFSQGRVVTVGAIVDWFPSIAQDHLKFLLKGHLTSLTVKQIAGVPKSLTVHAKEDRLIKTILMNPDLTLTDVDAHPDKYASLINLFIAMRSDEKEKQLASRQHQLRLHNDHGSEKDQDEIAMVVDFTDVETPSDVSIDLNMGSNSASVGTKMEDLFHEYGWAIRSLTTNNTLEDYHVTLLGTPVEGKQHKLTSFTLNPTSLTHPGLDALRRIFRPLKNLQHVGFYLDKLEERAQQDKALLLLRRYGDRLEDLTLKGTDAHTWLNRIRKSCATRCVVPKLSAFSILGADMQDIPNNQVEWISTMLLQPSASSSASCPGADPSTERLIPSDAWISLKSLSLHYVKFQQEGWISIITALDITAIEMLWLDNTNFSEENLAQLVGRLPEDGVDVALKTISVADTDLARTQKRPSLMKLLGNFKARTMGAQIIGFEET
ncbi:hypothetical protein BGX28_002393 [Mortierella sp. GBA30]|nr:hypothetical protein BGX28_002393 [Mortierella sp. GBA30]